MMDYLILLINLSAIGLIAIVFHKVRRIHLATFHLATSIQEIQQETNGLYAQIQAYLELRDLLKLTAPLPSLRGWAASPDFLLTVAQHVLSRKPTTILECSSGSSTIVIARCLQLNGKGQLYSLEHDQDYAGRTRRELLKQGLVEWATVIDAPLVNLEGPTQQRWYSLNNLPALDGSVELVVVDGPPGATNDLARYPAASKLKFLMAEDASLFLDDANRTDEQEIIKRWLTENKSWVSTWIPCEKGCIRFDTKPLILYENI